MFGDKTIYALNSAAVGDLIAAAPAIKYAIENFHRHHNYIVAVYPDFREIYHFVPSDRIVDFDASCESYPNDYCIRYLNPPKPASFVCKLTPSRMKLTQYASVNLLGRVLDDHIARYVKFKPADVTGYGVDFTKTVVIITTYRDKQRTILPEELKNISEYVQSRGLTPVYVGRRGKVSIWKNSLAISDFEDPGFGVDLRDKTSLSELATIMSMTRAVVGMDGGPIHVAFTTDTPVVCGFTTVGPKYRIPYRGLARTIAVSPNISCNFCESDWSLNMWSFNRCPRKLELAECVTKMTADQFIEGLNSLNIW